MNISTNSVVTMHYTLKNGGDQGDVLDSSVGAEPLVYIQGMGQIIPGLEKQMEGKAKGDKLQALIAPVDAYGERNDQMVNSMPKSEFPEPDQLAVGMQFQVDTDQGPLVLTILEVKDDEVVLDGNHPLAGFTLHFDVEITDIREATEEEIAHGHVHGEGGVHHE
jgi:FKBP-type peptidyl-prolyl cis-trans isomerase SlyD